MTDKITRTTLAIMFVVAGFTLYGVGKLSFEGLMAVIGPPVALYFGQYIEPPKEG